VCPTVSRQQALRPYSWMTQPSGSLAVRYIKIRCADCYAASSLSELGNLYRVHGVSLRIFGSTSLYTNIDIAWSKIDLNLSNSVQIYLKLSSVDIKVSKTLVVRKESSSKGSKGSIFISDLIKYKALLNISY
jgi:hypothetical protein